MKHEFRYSPQTITLTRPEDISKFEVGQTAPDEWVEALTGLSMSELSPGGHRQAKVVVSGIDREAGTRDGYWCATARQSSRQSPRQSPPAPSRGEARTSGGAARRQDSSSPDDP